MKKSIFLFLLLLLFSCSNNDKKSKDNSPNSKNGIIKGKVFYLNQPMDKAYVFANISEDVINKGVAYKTSEPTNQKGEFEIEVEPGTYYLTSKKKLGNNLSGPLLIGDYFAIFDKNPISVISGEKKDIGIIELKIVDSYGENTLNIPKNSGIKGKVIFTTEIESNEIFVYIYTNNETNLHGPSYITSAQINKDGSFTVNLSPGEYFIVSRKRSSGKKTGQLSLGDYNAEYSQNPVKVFAHNFTQINEIKLKKIDKEKYEKSIQEIFTKDKDTAIEGIITNEKKQPASNMYAFVYKESQMVGKPAYISHRTKADGKFILYLKEGTYYLGAREKDSGPIEDKEYVGSYNANQDHLIIVEKEKIFKNVKISVKNWENLDERE